MEVYLCVIGLLGFLAALNGTNVVSLENRGLTKNKMIVFFMIAVLVLVAGLRYGVGTDYFAYYKGYEQYKLEQLSPLEEPGIRIIARVSGVIYDDPATMMFLAAAITVILMTVTIVRNSDVYWLSLLLYIFLGCWHGCFNGVRQYLAASILFAGHCFIKERKLLQWLMIVIVAAMFHITAVIGVIFYFYAHIKINYKNLILSVLAAFIGINLYDRIFGMIGFLKSDTLDFVGEGAGYLTNSINPLRIAVAWVPVIFYLLFRKYYATGNKRTAFYLNMTILHAVLMTTAMNSTYLGRVGIYTGIYNTITWPILLEKVERRSRSVLIILMILFYMAYWYEEASGETLVNFYWIFQR